MANRLREQIGELSTYMKQIDKLSLVKTAKGGEGKKLRSLMTLLLNQIPLMQKEVDAMDMAMQARDEIIQAKCEQMNSLKAKINKPEPFFVMGKGELDDNDSGPRLIRQDEVDKWDHKRCETFQNDMLREFARLSLVPQGLDSKDLENLREELAANMKFSHLQRGSDVQKVAKKALDLIQCGYENDIPREKTRGFLSKKNLTDEQIDKYFEMFDAKQAELPLTKLPSLTRTDTASTMSEYDLTMLSKQHSMGRSMGR